MNKKILLSSIIAAMVAMPSFAAGDSIVTSKSYVDTQVGLKQDKIPATGNATGGTGTTVVMYTDTAGTVGERGIYSGTSYTSADANKLVTASALNGTVSNIPTITTSKLVCQNEPTCTLWTIDDQSVLGQSGN